MPRFVVSPFEFALEINQSYVDVAHGHLGIYMAEYLHQDRKADTGASHSVGI